MHGHDMQVISTDLYHAASPSNNAAAAAAAAAATGAATGWCGGHWRRLFERPFTDETPIICQGSTRKQKHTAADVFISFVALLIRSQAAAAAVRGGGRKWTLCISRIRSIAKIMSASRCFASFRYLMSMCAPRADAVTCLLLLSPVSCCCCCHLLLLLALLRCCWHCCAALLRCCAKHARMSNMCWYVRARCAAPGGYNHVI
jgi:hypothetical protein